ncbi:MAG TPA: hypothetical protein VFL85_01275 [Candidatus Saccharimonadales bacterium]|nr:hypothetical protein [Candidatus Saccharimonadales bacterium]
MSKQTDDIDGSQTEDDDSTQQNSPMTTPEELPARSQHGQSLNPQLSPPAQQQEVKSQSPEEARAELKKAILGTESVLAEIHSALIIPSVLLTLDRAKISAAKRYPIGSTGDMSLPMADVLNVTAHVGIIFGRVKIDKRVLSKEEAFDYGPFWRKDALRFATICQGYIMALQRNIDLSALGNDELREQLFKLGTDENIDYSGAEPSHS